MVSSALVQAGISGMRKIVAMYSSISFINTNKKYAPFFLNHVQVLEFLILLHLFEKRSGSSAG